jgi:hypothetical protein
MKKLFTLCLLAVAISALQAQTTTALVTYEGGYFVKNGKEWTEYRPAHKTGAGSKYKQYGEDDTFYYMKNKKCYLSIPKLYKDKIYIDRDKGKKNWEVVYNTLSVHQRCPDTEGLFYSYRNHRKEHGEYDGYFVRKNLVWQEFRPRMKSGVWAEFKQIDENNEYFILASAHNHVYIPKTTDNDIIIYKTDNNDWRGGYAIQAIYDRSAAYDYNFYYENSEKGGAPAAPVRQCRISFDRKGNIQLSYNGKFHDLNYQEIELVSYEGKSAVKITIDSKNRILLISSHRAVVDCRILGKKMFFINGDNGKAFTEVNDLLEYDAFEVI